MIKGMCTGVPGSCRTGHPCCGLHMASPRSLSNTWWVVSSWRTSYGHFLLLWLQPSLLNAELLQPSQRTPGLSVTRLAPGRTTLSLVSCPPRRLPGRVLCKHSPVLTLLTDRGRELPQRCTQENRLALPNLLEALAPLSRLSGWRGVGVTATWPLASWNPASSILSAAHSGMSHSLGRGFPLFRRAPACTFVTCWLYA